MGGGWVVQGWAQTSQLPRRDLGLGSGRKGLEPEGGAGLGGGWNEEKGVDPEGFPSAPCSAASPLVLSCLRLGRGDPVIWG